MLGVYPELSVAIGCDHETRVDVFPLSAMATMSFKQFEKTGAETSANKEYMKYERKLNNKNKKEYGDSRWLSQSP